MTGRIWIDPMGNMANRALQYLVAHGISRYAPDVPIQNIHLPEWGIVEPHPEAGIKNYAGTPTAWFDAPGLADCLKRQVIDTIAVTGYPYHLDLYPPRAVCRTLLGPAVGGESAPGFGAAQLVCSIRGAEVLDGRHPDYIMLPPEYYEMLAQRSGLDPVFFGQIGDDAYCDSLRRKFPGAMFVNGQSPGYDFEMLRRSVNIAPSLSTFAWLAAWLSEAERIFLPVGGFYSPVQFPNRSFLPLDDPAYQYILFPFSQAVHLRESPVHFAFAQSVLAAHSRAITIAELREIFARAAVLFPRGPLLNEFDKEFYERRNPDVVEALRRNYPSALHHYLYTGASQNRQPFDLDLLFYVTSYPDAALAIAEGYYAGAIQHYQAVGKAKFYRPTP